MCDSRDILCLHQAITWTNVDLLSIGPIGTNFFKTWIEIKKPSFKEKAFGNVCIFAASLFRTQCHFITLTQCTCPLSDAWAGVVFRSNLYLFTCFYCFNQTLCIEFIWKKGKNMYVILPWFVDIDVTQVIETEPQRRLLLDYLVKSISRLIYCRRHESAVWCYELLDLSCPFSVGCEDVCLSWVYISLKQKQKYEIFWQHFRHCLRQKLSLW